MSTPADRLAIEAVPVEEGVFRLSISGKFESAAHFSKWHREQIRESLQQLIRRERPVGIVVDCLDLENCNFGSTMAKALVVKDIRRYRVCILAKGKTLCGLRAAWDSMQLDRILPIFDDEPRAVQFVTKKAA